MRGHHCRLFDPLFDEAHQKGVEAYVKAVSGTYEQALRFLASLKPTKASPPDFVDKAKEMINQCYEKHIDLYLSEELAVFTSKADAEVISKLDMDVTGMDMEPILVLVDHLEKGGIQGDDISYVRDYVLSHQRRAGDSYWLQGLEKLIEPYPPV